MATKRHPGGIHQLDTGYTAWLAKMSPRSKTYRVWEPVDIEGPVRGSPYDDLDDDQECPDRPLLTHGTLDGYNNGWCRCDPCRAARAAYDKARRMR